MRTRYLVLAAATILITLLGFTFFPGHTWLQQDTQIYVPILEHLWNPHALAQDPVATHPHVAYTIYDELALAGRRITGWDFHRILTADQLLARALGIFGVFLIAGAMGLSRRLALLVAAVYGLGATVSGPAMLTVEYEPKPRGSALGLVLLAAGLLAHRRYRAAGIAGAVAFLYHPPTTIPFWGVYGGLAVFGSRDLRRHRLAAALPVVLAAGVLFLLARLQPGDPEPQSWFARIDPDVIPIMKMRAPYTWVSLWIGDWIGHYLLLSAVIGAGLFRLRKDIPSPLCFFLAGLPLAGMLSLGASYLLLDVGHWSLMAKFQPARAVLFVPLAAVIVAATAALRAASTAGGKPVARLGESLGWGVLAFAIPVQARVSEILLPDLSDPAIGRRVALVLLLAAAAVTAAWGLPRWRKPGWAAWSAALVAPFLLVPYFGHVVTERNMHHPELDELSAWARANTAVDAVFLFPDAGRGHQPGIFRAQALRAVYVDWKSGGQVNMVEHFARQWWQRYRETMSGPFDPSAARRYGSLGIDYIVVQPPHRLPGRQPAFRNARYLVYRLQPGTNPALASEDGSAPAARNRDSFSPA